MQRERRTDRAREQAWWKNIFIRSLKPFCFCYSHGIIGQEQGKALITGYRPFSIYFTPIWIYSRSLPKRTELPVWDEFTSWHSLTWSQQRGGFPLVEILFFYLMNSDSFAHQPGTDSWALQMSSFLRTGRWFTSLGLSLPFTLALMETLIFISTQISYLCFCTCLLNYVVFSLLKLLLPRFSSCYRKGKRLWEKDKVLLWFINMGRFHRCREWAVL